MRRSTYDDNNHTLEVEGFGFGGQCLNAESSMKVSHCAQSKAQFILSRKTLLHPHLVMGSRACSSASL